MTNFIYLIIRHETTKSIPPKFSLAEVTPHGSYSNHCEDSDNSIYHTIVVAHARNQVEEDFDIKIEFTNRADSVGSIFRWFERKEDAVDKMKEIREIVGCELDESAKGEANLKFLIAEGKWLWFHVLEVEVKPLQDYGPRGGLDALRKELERLTHA